MFVRELSKGQEENEPILTARAESIPSMILQYLGFGQWILIELDPVAILVLLLKVILLQAH